MNTVLTDEDQPSNVSRLNAIGVAVIVLGIATPGLLAMLTDVNYSAFHAGEDIGRLAPIAFVAWLMTRKRAPAAQAKGRIVAGALLIAVSINAFHNRHQEEKTGKEFVAKALAFHEQQAAKFADLGARFEKVNMSELVTPAAIATPQGIEQAKAGVAQLRALLAERRALFKETETASAQMLAGLPEGRTREAAMKAASDGKENLQAINDALDAAQLKYADDLSALLDWAKRENSAGRFFLARTGQMMFTSQPQQAEFRQLARQLQASENAVNAAVQAAQAYNVEKAKKMESHKAEAKRLLGR
jgi:hypothetical protein